MRCTDNNILQLVTKGGLTHVIVVCTCGYQIDSSCRDKEIFWDKHWKSSFERSCFSVLVSKLNIG